MFPLTSPLVARVRPGESLQVGDIAAFIGADSKLVFHRVVATTADGLRTRGDTNLHEDEAVPRDALLGRVVALRLGRLELPLPTNGFVGDAARRTGLFWGRVAPPLRAIVRASRRAWRRMSTSRA